MTETTATPEQIKEMRAAADAALKRMTDELKPLGVTETVAAIVLPKSVPVEQRIAFCILGTGEEVINLVGAMAAQMMPEDYSKLFYEMCTNPMFLRLLEVNRMQQQNASKPTVVN